MRPPPTHVNQFSARGRFPDTAPQRLRRHDSTPYDCMVASGVMDLDAATGGRIRLSTSELRARESDNDLNGIGLNDVAEAHRNTPGAPTLDYGTKAWPGVAARLRAADGAILTGWYIALGRSRASSFTGKHAIYAQRISGREVIVNDPLRSGVAALPLADVQRFYLSGIGQAGWSAGTGIVGGSASAPLLGAWGDLVTFPVGYVITASDVDAIMAKLQAAGWFPGPAGAIAAVQYRALLQTAIGQPWSKALQDQLAQAAASAASAASDPFGIASGLQGAAGAIVGGFGEVFRNGILLVAILGLVLMGLWLVATATDNPLPIPRPSIGV